MKVNPFLECVLESFEHEVLSDDNYIVTVYFTTEKKVVMYKWNYERSTYESMLTAEINHASENFFLEQMKRLGSCNHT